MRDKINKIALIAAFVTLFGLLYSCQDEYVAPYVDPNACNTTDVSFKNFIEPLMTQRCAYAGCHTAGAAVGSLATYDAIAAYAKNGKLVAKSNGTMNGMYLQDSTLGCVLLKVEAWVNQGAKNN